MSGTLIPWDRPRGTVHSLEAALALGHSGCNILVVSDVTLYTLQNLAALDVGFAARWAEELTDKGYKQVNPGTEHYSEWVDLIEFIRSEVIDVSCDWKGSLDDIATAIQESSADQSALLNRLIAAVQDIAYPVGPAIENYYPQPPSALIPDPEELDMLCWCARSATKDFCDGNIELNNIAHNLGQIGVGTIGAVLAAASLPYSAILAALIGVIEAVLEYSQAIYAAAVSGMYEDIVCAIYSAPNSSDAQELVENVIYAAMSEFTTNVQEGLVKQWHGSLMDSIFALSYPTRGDVNAICSECDTPELCNGEWDFQTENQLEVFGTPSAGTFTWEQEFGYNSSCSGKWSVSLGTGEEATLELMRCVGSMMSEENPAINCRLYSEGDSNGACFWRIVMLDETVIEGTYHYPQTYWMYPGNGSLSGVLGDEIAYIELVFKAEGAEAACDLWIDSLRVQLAA